MKSLTSQVHELLAAQSLQGETLIDATAGNGHDTLYLAQCTGPQGKVYAFDIQATAIEQTELRLTEAGYCNVEYLEKSHAEMLQLLPEELRGEIAAITFNLGYLPGGDKNAITGIDSTQQALTASVQLLKPGGLLTILAYTGHPGGADEADAVFEQMSRLPADDFSFQEKYPVKPKSPRLFIIRKNRHGD